MKKILLYLLLLFLSNYFIYSLNYAWTGNSNNVWSNQLNWRLNPSDGTDGNDGFPSTIADNALISGGFTSPQLSAPININNLDMSALTFSLNGNNLTINGNLTVTGGTFQSSGATTSTLSITGNLTVNGAATNFNLNNGSGANLNVTGNTTVSNNCPQFRITNRTAHFSGNFSVDATSTFNKIGSTVYFDGNTDTTVDNNSGGGFNNWDIVIVNKTGGARLILANHAFNLSAGTNNLTINAGAILDLNAQNLNVAGTGVFTNNGTLRLQGSETLSANVTQAAIAAANSTVDYYTGYVGDLKFPNYYNLIIEGGTRTVTGNSAIGGTLQLTGGQFDLTAAQTLNVTGTTNNAGTISSVNGNMTFTGAVTNSGTISTSGSSLLTFSNGVATTGTVTGNTGGITVSAGGVSGAGGTFNSGSGTVGITGNVTVDTFNGQSSALTITGNVNNTSFNSSSVSNSISGNFQATNFNAGNATTSIGGNFTVPDGTFTEGNSTINFTGGGTINQTNTFYNLTVSGGTRTTNGTVTVSNDVVISLGAVLNIGVDLLDVNHDITITGTLTSTGGNVNVFRNWTRTGTFNNGNNLVTFDGTGGGTISGSTFYNLTVNGTGTWTIGVTTVNNDLTLTSGTLSTGANNLSITGNASGAGNLICGAGTLDVTGNFNITGNTTFSTTNSYVGGTFTATTATYTNAGTLTFDTTAGSSITSNPNNLGTVVIAANKSLADNTATGGLTINSGQTLTTGANNITASSLVCNGTLDSTGGGTVQINGNVTSAAGARTITGSTGNINITGNATLTTLNDGNGNINIDGSLTAANLTVGIGNANIGGAYNVSTSVTNTGLIIFDTTAGSTITSNGLGMGNVRFDTNKQLSGNFTCTNITLQSGTLTDNGSTIFVHNDWTNNGGSLSATGIVNFNTAAASAISGNTTFNNVSCSTAGKQITIDNNNSFNNINLTNSTGAAQNINFNSGTNTITSISATASLTGSGQIITFSAGTTITNLTLSNTGSGTGHTVTINSSNTFNNFSVTNSGSGTGQIVNINTSNSYTNLSITNSGSGTGQTINILAGSAQNITNTLTLNGAAGTPTNKIQLRSTAASSWNIRIASAQAVSNVDVEYSNVDDASGGNITASSSINRNNNNDDAGPDPHWIFNPNTITWSATAVTVNWNNASNWDLGYVPNPTDNVIIQASANNPQLNYLTLENSITINGGGGYLTANGFNITTTTNCSIAGTLDLGDNTLTVSGTYNNTGNLIRTSAATAPQDNNSGTVTYNGTGGAIQDYGAGNDYYNLTINSAGQTFTAGSTIGVSNDLTITAGELDLQGNACNVSGSATGSGTLTGGAGNIDITGNLTITTFTASSNQTNVGGTYNVTNFTDNNGLLIFDTTAGSTITTNNQTMGNIRFSVNKTLSDNINSCINLEITAGTLDFSNRTINISGNWDSNGGAGTATNSTVNFTGIAGTQTIRTSGNAQHFYNVTVSNQAARTIQLLNGASTIYIDNDFTFNNGILDFNNLTQMNIGHDLLVNGGRFTDNTPGGPGMQSTLLIRVSHNFYAHATNANIYFDGRGPVGSEWRIWIDNVTGYTPANYGRVESNNAGQWVYATFSNAIAKYVGSARADWPVPVSTIVNCINWVDITNPYILHARSRLGNNRVYVEFSEEVRDENFFASITTGNINFTSGLTLNSIDQTVFGDDTRFIFRLAPADSITINDYATSSMQSQAGSPNRIVDTSFNTMNSNAIYYISHYQAVNPAPVVPTNTGYGIGIDFFTNSYLTSSSTDRLTNFSGSGEMFNNGDGIILTTTMNPALTGTPQIHYILTDSIGNNRFFIPPLTSGIKVISGQNAGGNTWRFNIPVSKNDGNKYFIFVYSIDIGGNTWYCYRPLYAANSSDTQFYQCETYIAKLKKTGLQNNNTTIVNNVINPVKGDTTKLIYTLDKEGPVSIVVYDLNSDVVKVLKTGNQSKGTYTISWDGKNENGKIVTRGVYFVRIRAPGIFNQIRKVLVIK